MSLRAVATLAVAALALFACGSPQASSYSLPTDGWTKSADAYSPPDSLVEEAKKEGNLVLYTGLTSGADVAKEFTKKYGIQVKTQLLTASQLESAFQSQSSARQYTADVVASAYSPFYPKSVKDGYLNPIDKEMPGFADYYPTEFLKDDGETPVTLILLTPVAYNTNLVKEADLPTTYKDLADPKWKGKLISTDPDSNQLLPSLYSLIGEKYGEETVVGIGQNTVRYYATNAAEMQALAAGEGAIAISAPKPVADKLTASGAPVKTIQFDFGIGAEFSVMASANAPHPAAAALFMAWIHSKEGQQIANKLLHSSSPLDPSELPKDYVTAPAATTEQRTHINQLLGR